MDAAARAEAAVADGTQMKRLSSPTFARRRRVKSGSLRNSMDPEAHSVFVTLAVCVRLLPSWRRERHTDDGTAAEHPAQRCGFAEI